MGVCALLTIRSGGATSTAVLRAPFLVVLYYGVSVYLDVLDFLNTSDFLLQIFYLYLIIVDNSIKSP